RTSHGEYDAAARGAGGDLGTRRRVRGRRGSAQRLRRQTESLDGSRDAMPWGAIRLGAGRRREPMRRAHKYHACPVDGYASTLERDRARELRLLEHAGEIHELVEQPRVELLPATWYRADFAYVESDGTRIWEEAKGV